MYAPPPEMTRDTVAFMANEHPVYSALAGRILRDVVDIAWDTASEYDFDEDAVEARLHELMQKAWVKYGYADDDDERGLLQHRRALEARRPLTGPIPAPFDPPERWAADRMEMTAVERHELLETIWWLLAALDGNVADCSDRAVLIEGDTGTVLAGYLWGTHHVLRDIDGRPEWFWFGSLPRFMAHADLLAIPGGRVTRRYPHR